MTDQRKQLTVGELRKFIKDLPEDDPVFVGQSELCENNELIDEETQLEVISLESIPHCCLVIGYKME